MAGQVVRQVVAFGGGGLGEDVADDRGLEDVLLGLGLAYEAAVPFWRDARPALLAS